MVLGGGGWNNNFEKFWKYCQWFGEFQQVFARFWCMALVCPIVPADFREPGATEGGVCLPFRKGLEKGFSEIYGLRGGP